MKKSIAQLTSLLNESVGFLEASAISYDNGFEGEAKRLATTIAVLLHDTPSSKSLLSQLNAKLKHTWLDTAGDINEANMLPTWGLVVAKLSRSPNQSYAEFQAPLEISRLREYVDFDTWWERKIIKTLNGELWSRKDLTLVLRNKEGGSHIDPDITYRYKHLHEGFTHSANAFIDGRIIQFEKNPALASMRQICFEVLTTLKP